MPVPVITVSQMREWEKATWATGQTEAEVIRLVGKRVAQYAMKMTKPADLILILAGKGHNGEDARAAREHLAERRADLLDVKDPAADFSKLEALLSLNPALVIDGLFGIGLNRPLNAEWIKFIERLNSAHRTVLAVDVPSGLNADSGAPEGAAVEAAVTLTVGAPKSGLLASAAWRYAGGLEIAQTVGLIPCPIQSQIQWTLPEDFSHFPPPRTVASHKGTYGHLSILAGSRGYHGAAVLATRGAQRAQPGLITLHAQESIYFPVAAQLQAAMVSPCETQVELPAGCTGTLVGPGLAAPNIPDTIKTFTRRLWQESPLAVVADASALAWLPAEKVPEGAIRVITPHPGEAARLLGTTSEQVQSDRPGSLRRLSARLGNAWVVLKGHQSLVGRNSGEIFVNSSGNAHLAQGGSGDTLAGYLAGLLAQPRLQADPLTTIRYAVWQHGAAADRLQEKRPGWVVEDLFNEL